MERRADTENWKIKDGIVTFIGILFASAQRAGSDEYEENVVDILSVVNCPLLADRWRVG